MVGAIMTDIRFAYATLADVDSVAALIERAYRGAEAARGWTNESEILTGPRSSAAEVEELRARSGLALRGCPRWRTASSAAC